MSTLEERFWAKVDRRGPEECWLWTASLYKEGYGKFRVGDIRGYLAHRFAYELLLGPIPAGMVIDHTCRVRRCVNPAHLESVTHLVNVRRGVEARQAVPRAPKPAPTHCANGHPFTEETRVRRTTPDGYTSFKCRICKRAWEAQRRARRRAEREAISSPGAYKPQDNASLASDVRNVRVVSEAL